MLDEEGEGGARKVCEALYFRLNEGREGDAVDLGGGVYDTDFYCCV